MVRVRSPVCRIDVPVSGALFFHISQCSSSFDDPDAKFASSFRVFIWQRGGAAAPSQARTSSTALRRGRQKWEQWRSQRNVPTRNWKMCSSTAPLRASQQGGLLKRQSISFKESPSRERRLVDQRCSSQQAWNPEVLHELRHARNPVIGLPHVDVSSSWMRGVNNVDEPHRSLR